MPTYTYRCDTCGHQFETVQRFSDDPLTECPSCGAAIRRVIQPVGVVFKGSGWYITDSRKPEKESEAESRPAAGKDAAASKDSGAKPEPAAAKAATEKPVAKAAAE